MKKHKRMVWVGLALVVMLLLAAGSASARATRTPVTYYGFSCAVIDPGTEWYSGDEPILHVRGRVIEQIIVSDDIRLAGSATIAGGFNINLATGSGNVVHGTWTLQPDAVDGTWEGTWSGHWTAMVLSARIIGHGTGDLAGLKMFGTLQSIEIPVDPPPPCAAFGADATSGEILDPHGE